MTATILTGALIFDGVAEPFEGMSVVVEGDRIVDLVHSVPTGDVRVIDCSGKFMMPGLIDAHFHAYSPSYNIAQNDRLPSSLMASHAAKVLRGALRRGFTTVRDAAGGDRGLQMAIDQGLIDGPRFFFSGKALSQTGGHGDFRSGDEVDLCGCGSNGGTLSQVVDGADGVRLAAREELRKGASQIKIFVSGGALSPTDPMWMPQFTDDEILAAVEEAATRRTYVMAHSHTDESSRRCALLGVRSIEHGSLIHSDETARIIAQREAYVVPTLSVADVFIRHADELGLSPMVVSKSKANAREMFSALEVCERNGVKLGFGTDLLDHRFHPWQGGEFELRGTVSKPIDVLRSATSVNADLMQMSGQIGCLRPGAFADIVVMSANPLTNLALFRSNDNLPLVMKGGRIIRNAL